MKYYLTIRYVKGKGWLWGWMNSNTARYLKEGTNPSESILDQYREGVLWAAQHGPIELCQAVIAHKGPLT